MDVSVAGVLKLKTGGALQMEQKHCMCECLKICIIAKAYLIVFSYMKCVHVTYCSPPVESGLDQG